MLGLRTNKFFPLFSMNDHQQVILKSTMVAPALGAGGGKEESSSNKMQIAVIGLFQMNFLELKHFRNESCLPFS